MKKIFQAVEGVSNIELFYDLIFVYCISVITSLMHHVHDGFFDLNTWLVFTFSYLVVLQVWFFTTFLLNRYGDRSASDNVCLFISMFLLYFLANGIQDDWENAAFTFNIAWALILANLLVHWTIKRMRYTNLDDDDKHIMNATIATLGVQLVVCVIAALLDGTASIIVSWVALIFGVGVFTQMRSYRRKTSRFGHLVERCALLTIVAFGETIVAIATFMTDVEGFVYPIFVFALVVGLFLIYIYEHDNMLDHHKETDGMAYLTLTGWIIFIIGNLTVALEYMPMEEVAFLPKSLMLTICLIAYLLTSFLMGLFNKPQYHYSIGFILGRIGTCVLIAAVAFFTDFDPFINLIADTALVYFALWHEWLLYHGRTQMVAFCRSLGYTDEEIIEDGSLTSFETRQNIRKAARQARAGEFGVIEDALSQISHHETPDDTEQ
ncbi:MAG: low temperature requirement protein A [Eggerthellaceae bacterium]|nr:low temperature requirement protein A [Eggerthellaceae bacterium]